MMITAGKIFPNIYRDSIALMRVANELSRDPGVDGLEILLGTPGNLESLRLRELCPSEVARASINDIVVVVRAKDSATAQHILQQAETRLLGKQTQGPSFRKSFVSLEAATRAKPQANLALISIPGPFVKKEALSALQHGLNVMIFSDNVPLQDELEIKQSSRELGLMVMGPDCGTAILAGVGLGFANRVATGSIGIIGASGTGIQEVSCLLDRAGVGVSHCIGTGSNDVKEEIGGISFLQAIDLLEDDPQTAVIVLLSKPPAPNVEARLRTRISRCRKPVVVNFLGSDGNAFDEETVYSVQTLEEAALTALQLSGVGLAIQDDFEPFIAEQAAPMAAEQKYIRGIFTGGTLAIEAGLILQQYGGLRVVTNAKSKSLQTLADPFTSSGHTCVDLGDDVFTAGKPHPMLDPLMRRERILKEAADPETAILLLDFVLGLGVHPEPVAGILETLNQAQNLAARAGRHLSIVTAVCGTDADPQNRSRQVQSLKENGCLVFESNAQAARFSAQLIMSRIHPGGNNA
jgi:FdrA protein